MKVRKKRKHRLLIEKNGKKILMFALIISYCIVGIQYKRHERLATKNTELISWNILNNDEDNANIIYSVNFGACSYSFTQNQNSDEKILSPISLNNSMSLLDVKYNNNIIFQELKHSINVSSSQYLASNVESVIDGAQVKKLFGGINMSILADSISTFEGYSNDVSKNNTIGKNSVYYTGGNSGITNVEQTWWFQISEEMGINILVNNSYSGSRVTDNVVGKDSAGYIRAEQLHDDAGIQPDIVAVFLGINDFDNNVVLGSYDEELHDMLIDETENGGYIYEQPKTFTEAYIIMIHKIVSLYDNADVFCFTLLPNGIRTDYDALKQFNETIRKIANYYDVEIVDLYNDSGITSSNYLSYSDEKYGLHPNEIGMSAIKNTFKKVLIDTYIKQSFN